MWTGVLKLIGGVATGTSLLPLLLGGAALLAVPAGGYFAYESHIAGLKDTAFKDGAKAQLALDGPKLDAANQRIGSLTAQVAVAQADASSCVEASKRQNDGIKRITDAQAAVQAAARAEAVKRAVENAKAQSEIDRLRTIAAAKPQTDQSCAAELAKVDAILTKSLKERRERVQ